MSKPTDYTPRVGERFNAPDPYVDPKHPEKAKPRPVVVVEVAEIERRGVTELRCRILDEGTNRRTWMRASVLARCPRLPTTTVP